MRTLVQMANRSDRREGKPATAWAMKARPDDWLLARGSHFGQERQGAIPPASLQSQAGDTYAGLTRRHRPRHAHRTWWKQLIRGPTTNLLTTRRSPDTQLWRLRPFLFLSQSNRSSHCLQSVTRFSSPLTPRCGRSSNDSRLGDMGKRTNPAKRSRKPIPRPIRVTFPPR